MGNEVDLFKGGVPAHLKGEVSETTKALMGGGGSQKRVSIRGGVFRMMVGREEVAKNTDRAMNFIIVGSAPGFARTYYAGQYKEGDNKPPTCWSDDGKAPHPSVVEKQSKTCADCPMNVKGSGQEESRACRYSARIAVLLDNDMEGDMYAMSIPATSLFGEPNSEKYESLQGYARKLAGYGFDIRHVVTEMRFDTDSDVPKLMFAAVRPLEANEWEIVKDIEGTEELDELVGPREFSADEQNDAAADNAADDGDGEEAEEEKPRRRRKKKPEPEPEPDETEADTGDEEEKPKPKRRRKKPEPKPEPEADDDEEEEEPPKKRKKKAEPEVDDDDDDLAALVDEWAGGDEYDDDEDED